MDSSTVMVDFRPVKDGVAKLFAPGHPFREAILAEQDQVPKAVLASKLEVYLRMAWAMRAKEAQS